MNMNLEQLESTSSVDHEALMFRIHLVLYWIRTFYGMSYNFAVRKKV